MVINQYHGKIVIFGFNYRGLYKPNWYRVDGIWGQKKRYCLFPFLRDQQFSDLYVYTPKHPINYGYQYIETGLNIYHLKMINKKDREYRKNLYKKLDPNNQIQSIGYDYLDDATNQKLQRIPLFRGYTPKYSFSGKESDE